MSTRREYHKHTVIFDHNTTIVMKSLRFDDTTRSVGLIWPILKTNITTCVNIQRLVSAKSILVHENVLMSEFTQIFSEISIEVDILQVKSHNRPSIFQATRIRLRSCKTH